MIPPYSILSVLITEQAETTHKAGPISFALESCYTCYEPFKVKLAVVEYATTLNLEFHFDNNLFDLAGMQILADQFLTLLANVVKQPDALIRDFAILSPAERQLVLVDFNQTKADYPAHACLHHLFEAQVERTPDAIAVQYEEQQLTYHALNWYANQLACYLQTQGVGPEVLVGIYLTRSPLVLAGILGVLKAGGAYVPLDLLHPRERLTFILADADVPLVLTSQSLRTQLPSSVQCVCLDTMWQSFIVQQKMQAPATTVQSTNLVYVIYTSGSTGQPKGVMITHQGVVHYLHWSSQYYKAAEGSGSPVHSPLTFDLTVTGLFAGLMVGQRLVLLPEEQGIEQLRRTLSECNHFSFVKLTPAHLEALNNVLDTSDLATATQTLIIGGEALRGNNLTLWHTHAPTTRIINEYGPTETVVGCCIYEVASPMADNVPIGRPISNTQLYVLDARLQPVPLGVSGELYIGGVGPGRGYLQQPDLTAERFIPHPFATQPGERLYRTGDLVRYIFHTGQLEYLGRIDHQVKLRGYRIELGEIETVLTHHINVREAVVMLREDLPGGAQIVAYITYQQLPMPTTEALQDFISRFVPEYMIPSTFVFLKDLPLTTNGKVDRHALPIPTIESATASYVAPRSPIEDALVTIWEETLNVKPVGIYDNFFDLGGHSLLATQIIARLRRTLEVELPVRTLLDALTIARLAEAVEHASGQEIAQPALRPLPRPTRLPLSFAQQRLWFLDQMEPNSTTYLIPATRRLRGPLSFFALQLSLRMLVTRHESLRTTFLSHPNEQEPSQVIHPPDSFWLPLIDLHTMPASLAQTLAHRLATQEASQPCDLQRGPLFRACLLRLSAQDHVLLLTMHHSISDGQSQEILYRELRTLYHGLATHRPITLPALPIQYADYALWQREWLQGSVLQTQLDYWKQQLAAPPVLELPTDHPRPAIQRSHGALRTMLIPAEIQHGLLALSRQQGVTLFMLLLAAFQVLLARYSGQTDICVGTPIANRSRQELEGLIGFFVNTLVLRGDLSGNPAFLELLQRVRTTALQAYTHQDIPFEQLVEALQPPRDLSRSPLFQVSFNLEQAIVDSGVKETEISALTLSKLHIEQTTVKFDLSFTIISSPAGLQCAMSYNTDLFTASTIQRLLSHWQVLLTSILAQPSLPLAALPILTSAEHTHLLHTLNVTTHPLPARCSVYEPILQQAQRTPDALALSDDALHLSYHALTTRATHLAHHLQHLGMRPEQSIAVCLPRSADLVLALLAILQIGAIYVPLDPTLPTHRLKWLLHESQTALLLTQEPLLSDLPETIPCVTLTSLMTHTLPPTPTLPISHDPDQLAYLIYTSGSTGHPKGVMVSQRSLFNQLDWRLHHFQSSARGHVLHQVSVGFDVSLWEILLPLWAGGRLVLARPQGQQDPEYLAHVLNEEQITLARFGPSMLALLLQTGAWTQSPAYLQDLVCAGEELSVALWTQVHRRCGAQIHHQYGPTESTIISTSWRCESDEGCEKIPVGHPLQNTEIFVLDAFGQPTPYGVTGEIFLGGVGLARGYFQRPDLTAERFLPHPFPPLDQPGARLYRTGDLGRLRPDGALEILGRRDAQVKLRGYRVELGEIEVVLRQLPTIATSVVLLHHPDADAEHGPLLIAYIVPVTGQDAPSSSQVRAFLRERLPDYMVPQIVLSLPTLPLTPNGKVDRQALPRPQTSERSAPIKKTSPSTDIEALLFELWSDVLPQREIDLHTSFFDLGGHSLLATRLVARMRSILQIDWPLRRLFEAPTIAQQAQLIRLAFQQQQQAPTAFQAPLPLLHHPYPARLPLSFAQQRLWFLDQLEPGSSAYLIPSLRILTGKLDLHALRGSVEDLIARHEILRTTFQAHHGSPVQVIHPVGGLDLPLIDLQGLSPQHQELQQHHLAKQEAQQPCSLEQGPLLRLRLVRREPQQHLLLLTLHHIIFDGWSDEIFFRELSTLYQARCTQQPMPLAPLPIQYADYALWQRNWLQGEVLDFHLAYWKRQLAGATPLQIPTDHPRPALQSNRGMHVPLHLSVELQAQLNALSRRGGVTLFMTLLASFQLLLARYSGQTDISVGVPIANRTRTELEPLIGFFVNTLVLRTNLDNTPTFLELLARVREVALGAYTHQDIPFEHLVEVLQPERDLSRNPLFQVMFILQNIPTTDRDASEIHLSSWNVKTTTTKFDLTLSLGETPLGLRGQLDYNVDLFDHATITRMAGHWQTLLEAIIAHPEQKISTLPLLTFPERQQMQQWNNTGHAYPEQRYLHQIIEANVDRIPDAIALCCDDEHITYQQLNQQANKVGWFLAEHGAGPEVYIGLFAERSIAFAIAMLAVLKACAIYLPLDPLFPVARLEQMLQQSRPAFILTTSAYSQILQQSSANLPQGERPHILDLKVLLQQQGSGTNLPVQCQPQNLAYVIYTSGSTGVPKGVMVEHRGMLNHLYAKIADVQLSATDIVAQNGPQSFDISIWQYFAALMLGGQVRIFRDEIAFNPVQLIAQIEEKAITVLQLVPSMLREITHELLSATIAHPALLALRWIVPTGDALHADLCRTWLSLYPHIPLLNTYGSTECSDDQCHYPITDIQPAETEAAIMKIGSPIPNMRAYILDHNYEPIPIGIIGELYIGGIGVGRGYLNNPERTAMAFIPDPFSSNTGTRMYKTGDLARYYPDGTIEFLGRIDHLIKIRGYRIELGEIEAILRQHPQIHSTVVVAQKEESGIPQLIGYIVAQEGENAPSPHIVRSYLQGLLPDYMVPTHIILLETLPLTSNGKVDRHALPLPTQESITPVEASVAPRSAAEEVVAQIWMDVLHRPKIGVYDNFFTIGGHSLLATQVISRLSTAFQLELPLRTLFEAPTIDGLVNELARRHGERETVEEIALILQEIDQLTEDEVVQHLSR